MPKSCLLFANISLYFRITVVKPSSNSMSLKINCYLHLDKLYLYSSFALTPPKKQ